MKQIIYITVFAGLATLTGRAAAQSLFTMGVSPQYASFHFIDSKGEIQSKNYKGIFTGAYQVGFKSVSEGGFIMSSTIGMRNVGSSLVYDGMNYSWRLQYADIRGGLGYAFQVDRIKQYLLVSGYYAYMLRGVQTLNNEDFNITKTGSLNRNDYGLILSPGVEYNISERVTGFVEFNYFMGLKNIEMDENQKAFNRVYGFTLGVAIPLQKK